MIALRVTKRSKNGQNSPAARDDSENTATLVEILRSYDIKFFVYMSWGQEHARRGCGSNLVLEGSCVNRYQI